MRKLSPFGKLPPFLFLYTCLNAILSFGGTPAEKPVEISVHLRRGLSTINPFIYGQFIEHMGNCVYRGIWAEMLADRKFYWPVAVRAPKGNRGNQSPWKRVGKEEEASVGMDSLHPYAGRWSVELATLGRGTKWAGIKQGNLSFVNGRKYSGYVVAQSTSEEIHSLEVRAGCSGTGQLLSSFKYEPGPEWKRYEFSFKSGESTKEGFLELGIKEGAARIGAVSLMPADNVEGIRADTLEVLRALKAPVYRWPGGNFVSTYNWWEAIGERDKRPPAKNRAWPGIVSHDFGIHEFLRFCRLVEAEPLVVVNTGLGSPRMASALVEYVNSDPETKWGKKRARNGHPKPYGVTWWGVGNEMYGNWQHGAVSCERYAARHKAFARAMREADPEIKLVGVGASGKWSLTMLRECKDYMSLLSEHFYCPVDENSVIQHVRNMREAVRNKARSHMNACEKLFGEGRMPVGVALDEWNYSGGSGEPIYGYAGFQYSWRDGMGIAAGLCELIKRRRVFEMANFAQTVNVLGAVKTTSSSACISTSGLPFILFRHRFGRLGLTVKGDTSPLEAAGGMTADGKNFTLSVINPTPRWQELAVDIKGGNLSGRGERFLLAHPNPEACNKPVDLAKTETGDPTGPPNPALRIERPHWLGVDPSSIPAAPYSVTLWRLELASARTYRAEPVKSLKSPKKGGRLLMLYAQGNRIYAAAGSNGLAWEKPGDGKPLLTLKGNQPVEGISACSKGNHIAVVMERAGKLYVSEGKTLTSLSSVRALRLYKGRKKSLFDPCMVFCKDMKKYILLFSAREGNAPSRIEYATGGKLEDFSPPQTAVARSYDVRGPSLLTGDKSFLFYYDDRLGTCRMGYSGRPDGSYHIASPPLGQYGAEEPKALFTGEKVILYMAKQGGGCQVLSSGDLRLWRHVPERKISLPAQDINCFCFIWQDGETGS